MIGLFAAALIVFAPGPTPQPNEFDPVLEQVSTCMAAKQRLALLSQDVPGVPLWDASKIAERELFTTRRCKAALNTPDADMRAVLQDWAAESQ